MELSLRNGKNVENNLSIKKRRKTPKSVKTDGCNKCSLQQWNPNLVLSAKLSTFAAKH